MSLLTLIGIDDNLSNSILVSGSMLVSPVTSSFYIRLSILIIFIMILLFYKVVRNKRLFKIILLCTFILWLISGKMIGITPEGQIFFAWHYVETCRASILNEDQLFKGKNLSSEEEHEISERVVCQETYYEKISYLVYRVYNKQFEVIIYSTPFIDLELERVLAKHYKKSTYQF
jgi:hypothetical protein